MFHEMDINNDDSKCIGYFINFNVSDTTTKVSYNTCSQEFNEFSHDN